MRERKITIKVLKAVLALDSKNFAESLSALKELGYDHSNRFEYSATEFVSDLVKEHIKELEEMDKICDKYKSNTDETTRQVEIDR